MKTPMHKILALTLALVLCLGILAGCNTEPTETTQGTTASTQGTTSGTEGTTGAPAYSFEGKTLDVICGHDINGLPLDGFIEEAIGLDVKWTPRGTDEQIQAMMTDKVTPSLLFGYGPDYGHEMGRYGAFVNLYDWYDEMPNFFARYEAYGDEIKQLYETAEGELYSAPVFLNGDVQHYGWYYREDIFAKLNLSAPTNWQEFLDVCAALKAEYPDCYPFTMRNMTASISGLYEFAQQFGVDYRNTNPALNYETGTWYNPYTTDEARNMLKMIRSLIDLGYMDVAALANTTDMWVADLSSGKSFITHDKAFQLTNLEKAGKEMDENFSLSWWHNLPLVESDLPYQCRASRDYMYSWSITTKCADVELAVHYLDWMYSDEGSLILSWGKEGESYGIDENGNKYFLEGYDKTYQARYQESGYIDMKATAATYTEKCQEMIFDTMEQAAEGDFWAPPSLVWNADEQKLIDTYWTEWYECKNAYYQKYLLGELNLEDDATWEKFKSDMAALNEEGILQCFNDAYTRFMAGEK